MARVLRMPQLNMEIALKSKDQPQDHLINFRSLAWSSFKYGFRKVSNWSLHSQKSVSYQIESFKCSCALHIEEARRQWVEENGTVFLHPKSAPSHPRLLKRIHFRATHDKVHPLKISPTIIQRFEMVRLKLTKSASISNSETHRLGEVNFELMVQILSEAKVNPKDCRGV